MHARERRRQRERETVVQQQVLALISSRAPMSSATAPTMMVQF